jgi:endogenous inhibitor of DNA gyrase (YacG/DUF329 family)
MSEAPSKPCPICSRSSVARFRPFCSARCADVDLGRWLTGSYAIPVPDDELDDEDDGGAGRPVGAGHDRTS